VNKGVTYFIRSAGLLLLITGTAKLTSVFGHARILQVAVPYFGISFRWLFVIAGVLEMIVAGVCLFNDKPRVQAALIAWLATNFMLYRVGLLLIGYHKPCPCLGNLTDVLHLSPEAADNLVKCSLFYLLIGSYATILLLWTQGKNQLACARRNDP
jgi:hypothetical protein